MSTRAQIGFYPNENTPLKDHEALIYKHSDGYPEKPGIFHDMLPILRDFNKNRGLDDIEYGAAMLVHELKVKMAKDDEKFRKEMNMKSGNGNKYLQIGISKDLHGDIEYFYKVSPQSVRVFEVGVTSDDDADMFSDMKELKKWRRSLK